MEEVFLGVDLGTTNCKVVVYDVNGNRIAKSEREYKTFYPKPLWAEQDPQDWLVAFIDSLKEAVRRIRGKYKILAISVTSQREGVVPVSATGKVLDRCIIWMDERSIPQVNKISKIIEPSELYNRTGLRLSPTFTATKVLWLKENRPKVYERTRLFLQPKEYINFIITGKAFTDPSLASRTLLFNIHKLSWDSNIASAIGISLDKFPAILPSNEIIGYMKEDITKDIGLNKKIPIINGGGDRPCEALGAGAIRPEIASESTGTATNISISTREILLDPKERLVLSGHVIKGLRLIEAGTTPTGAILRWFRDNLLPRKVENKYELINYEAEKIRPGAEGLILLPYFMGAKAPRWNPNIRGAFIGLTLAHTWAHIARSIMEGIAYLTKEILDAIEDLNVPVKTIISLGGAAKSKLWSTIKASVWNRQIIIPKEIDAAPLGAAMLAGIGINRFKKAEDAVKSMVSYKEEIRPRESWIPIYKKQYKAYIMLSDLLEKAYKDYMLKH